MISRTDVLAHLERGMRVGFLKGSKAYTPLRAPFTKETTSDGAFETYTDMGALPWPEEISGQSGAQGTDGRTGGQVVGGLLEGGSVTVLGGNERSMTVFNRGFDIAIGIFHDAINDNKVGSLESWALGAGSRFEMHKDFLAFDALNSGAATTYGYGYDGLVMFSASHVDPGAQYTTVQSNVNTSALSIDNFETVSLAASKYLDDRGKYAGLSPDLLVHAVDLKRVATQITDNPMAYDTANREINPYEGDIRRLSAPGGWLDTTCWILVVSNLPQKPLNLQIRQAPMLYYWDDQTQAGGVRYYKWYARYEVFYGDWRLASQGNT